MDFCKSVNGENKYETRIYPPTAKNCGSIHIERKGQTKKLKNFWGKIEKFEVNFKVYLNLKRSPDILKQI